MAVLSDPEIQTALSRLPGWTHLPSRKAIQREFTFPDFASAMIFVNRVAEAAEEANHHPDMDIRYNKVTLLLASHDSGGITKRDIRLAGVINQIGGE